MLTNFRVESVEERRLAATDNLVEQSQIPATIQRSLNQIWPVLRDHASQTGNNVVIYRSTHSGELAITVGVEVLDLPIEEGDIHPRATPAGRAAVVTHFGDYTNLGKAYRDLVRWCEQAKLSITDVSWEIYGDWDENPTRRRTDVFLLLAP